jgi:MFS family permease
MAPATLAMLIVGPFAGRMVARQGPKPILFVSACAMLIGLVLFIVNRGNTTDLTVDMIFALIGVVCTIIPIVNMISVSLPRQTIAVGLGINTMLRNLGGAIGPVVATVIMTTYTTPMIVDGHPVPGVMLPSAMAFNLIFEIGLVLTVLVIALAAASKNYTFRGPKNGAANQPASASA